MGKSGVSNFFKIVAPADSTDAFEVIPAGNRVRVYSVVWQPKMLQESPATITDLEISIELTNGQSGSVLYESGFYFDKAGTSMDSSGFSAPRLFEPISANGILFTDGIWCQGKKISGPANTGGICAVSITYQ